jgi:cellulose synthase/poly-beta-1,6-N-acetylglucosamine synthase-like glycosyltransferase
MTADDAASSASSPSLPPLPLAPSVSVIIPALHAADVVGHAIDSCLAQEQVAEVVVATGDPDTRQAVAAAAVGDDRVRVVDNPSGRTPDALNAAIAASTGEVIVRVDAGAVLPPGYVATAVATLAATGAGNVGGAQVPTAERGFARAVAVAMRSPAGAGGATYRVGGSAGPVDTVYLGVFRRAALDAVGGYDPRFTRNQDAELNLRLRSNGYVVWFDPGLAVAYRPRGTVRGLASQYLQYGRWRRLTVRTHRGSVAPRQLAAPLLVLGLVVFAAVSAVVGSVIPIGAVVAVYLAALIVAAVVAVSSLAVVPGVVVALATMHLSWGVGFLLGPPRGAEESRST